MLEKHVIDIWRTQEVEKIISKGVKAKMKALESGIMPTYIEISRYDYNILDNYNKENEHLKIEEDKMTFLGLKVLISDKKDFKNIKIL